MTFTQRHRLGCNKIIGLDCARARAFEDPSQRAHVPRPGDQHCRRGAAGGAGSSRCGRCVIIGAGLFDMVDGRVARETNRVTRFGGFFDSVLDRYSDLALLMGLLVWYGSINRSVLCGADGPGDDRLGDDQLLRGRGPRTRFPPARSDSWSGRSAIVLLIIGALFDRMAPVLWVIAVLGNLTVIPPHDVHLAGNQAPGRSPTRRAAPAQDQSTKYHSSLEDHVRQSVLDGVGQRQADLLHSQFGRRCLARHPWRLSVGRPLGRLATSKSCHRTPAPTSTQGLHARLFGREARGKALDTCWLCALHRQSRAACRYGERTSRRIARSTLGSADTSARSTPRAEDHR